MKIAKKIMILMLLAVFVSTIYASSAASGVLKPEDAINSTVIGSPTLNASVYGAWNLIKVIIQAVAIGVVLFAGVRYMMASADQKADIKKSLMWLVIGAVIAFGSTTVIQYIVVAVNDFLN